LFQSRDGNCLRQGDKVEYTKAWDERQKKDRAQDVTGGRTEDRPPRRDSRNEVCRDFQAGRCTYVVSLPLLVSLTVLLFCYFFYSRLFGWV
jgi:hypothetical protein